MKIKKPSAKTQVDALQLLDWHKTKVDYSSLRDLPMVSGKLNTVSRRVNLQTDANGLLAASFMGNRLGLKVAKKVRQELDEVIAALTDLAPLEGVIRL